MFNVAVYNFSLGLESETKTVKFNRRFATYVMRIVLLVCRWLSLTAKFILEIFWQVKWACIFTTKSWCLVVRQTEQVQRQDLFGMQWSNYLHVYWSVLQNEVFNIAKLLIGPFVQRVKHGTHHCETMYPHNFTKTILPISIKLIWSQSRNVTAN